GLAAPQAHQSLSGRRGHEPLVRTDDEAPVWAWARNADRPLVAAHVDVPSVVPEQSIPWAELHDRRALRNPRSGARAALTQGPEGSATEESLVVLRELVTDGDRLLVCREGRALRIHEVGARRLRVGDHPRSCPGSDVPYRDALRLCDRDPLGPS